MDNHVLQGGQGNGGSRFSEGGLEKLEELVLELMGSVRMLKGETAVVVSASEMAMGEGRCILSLEDANEKEKEEDWVNVVREDDDSNPAHFQTSEELKKAGDTTQDEDGKDGKEFLLPHLSMEWRDGILEGIASTTTQILFLTQKLHSLSPSASSTSTPRPLLTDTLPGTTTQPITTLAFNDLPTLEELALFESTKTYPLITLDSPSPSSSTLNTADSTHEKVTGKVYKCQKCSTHLALGEDVISRNFRGQKGKAALFNKVWNIARGKREERIMTTGRHLVVDVHCRECKEYVGWGYEEADKESERYKVGKVILEMEGLC